MNEPQLANVEARKQVAWPASARRNTTKCDGDSVVQNNARSSEISANLEALVRHLRKPSMCSLSARGDGLARPAHGARGAYMWMWRDSPHMSDLGVLSVDNQPIRPVQNKGETFLEDGQLLLTESLRTLFQPVSLQRAQHRQHNAKHHINEIERVDSTETCKNMSRTLNASFIAKPQRKSGSKKAKRTLAHRPPCWGTRFDKPANFKTISAWQTIANPPEKREHMEIKVQFLDRKET